MKDHAAHDKALRASLANEQNQLEYNNPYLRYLETISKEDVAGLRKAQESYGDSWKKRGGVGAYMMLVRKIDRMDVQTKKHGYDVFAAIEADQRSEGILDDIRDLRRYLMLVEAEVRARGVNPAHRDNDNSRTSQKCATKFDNPNFGGVSIPPTVFRGNSGDLKEIRTNDGACIWCKNAEHGHGPRPPIIEMHPGPGDELSQSC